MQKNVASQKLIVFAFDATTNQPATGDAANLTAYVSKDYGSVTVLTDTSATEMDATNAKGYYLFDLAQAETNADTLLFSAKSSTSNIVVIAVPATVFTVPASFNSLTIANNATAANVTRIAGAAVSTSTAQLGVNVVNLGGTAQTARDIGASVLLSSGTGTGQLKLASGYVAMTWADIAAPTTTVNLSGTTIATTQKVDVNTIKTNAVVNAGTITFPTGATLASTTNITAASGVTISGTTTTLDALQTALNSSHGAGSWATATGFSTHSAADVWSVGTRLLTAGTNIVLAKGTGVTGFNDLSAAQVNAEADTALSDVGLTATITGRIDAAVSTRLATAGYTAPLDAAGVRTAVGLGSANLDTQLADVPTVAEFEARTVASATYATAANLATVAGYLDTEIAAILEDTGTTIPAQIAALNNITAASVWAAATRTLTAGTNIDGSTFAAIPWNAAWDAEVQSEVADALAVYDPPTNAEMEARTLASAGYGTAANQSTINSNVTAVGVLATAILEDTGTTLPAQVASLNNLSAAQVTAAVPTAAQNAAAILAAGDVDGFTVEETLKLCLAILAGKLSGAATTAVAIRAADDSKARVTATVDASGNRSAVTLDAAG